MSMNITDARAWVRDVCRNAKSSANYTDAQIDRSIIGAGQEFIRETGFAQDDVLSISALVQATGVAVLNAGTVASVTVSTGGHYAGPVPVSFTGGGGSGAAGVCVLDATGGVASVTMTSGGADYNAVPTVVFPSAATSSAVPLPSFPSGFRRDRLKNAYNIWPTGYAFASSSPTLTSISYAQLLRLNAQSLSGYYPLYIAFISETAGLVWPAPTVDWQIGLRWTPLFPTWTPGTGTPDLSMIPDDYLQEILTSGVCVRLQEGEPEMIKSGALQAKQNRWTKFMLDCKNALNSGSMEIISTPKDRNRGVPGGRNQGAGMGNPYQEWIRNA